MKNSLRSGFWKFLPLSALILTICFSYSSGAQTIFTSGFESGDPAFTFSAPATGQGSAMPFFGVSTINPRTGTQSGRAVGGSGSAPRINGSIITPQLTFEPGYTYTVQFYARVDAANAPVNVSIYRTSTPTHSGVVGGTSVSSPIAINTTSYQLFSTTFTVPATTSQYIGFHVQRNANGGAINIDDVSITRTCIPSTSNAGSNISTCATSAGLAATLAPWETGTWSVISGTGNFSNVNDPNTTVSGLSSGANVFQWTVTYASCPTITSTVTVTKNESPSITGQPVSQSVCEGQNVSFSVTATGSNLFYQWKKNGANILNGGNISGVFTSTLNITNVTTANAGNYTVVVSGSCPPSVTSSVAVLTVGNQPSITSQPTALQNLCSGATLNLSVTVAGSNINYQWRLDGTPVSNGGNISGATSSSLTVTNVSASDAGTYDVVVSSPGCSSDTSSGAIVNVDDSPSVTVDPTSQVVCEGTNVNLSVTATGSNLSYQWRKDGVDLTNGGNISGANSSTLTLSNVTGSDDGNYDVIVSNGLCPDDTSAAATLTVEIQPVIVTQPQNEVGCDSSSVSLSVVVTGTNVTYQWRKNGVNLSTGPNIANVTSATLVINPFSPSDTGSYDVIISGDCGSPFISAAADLTLGAQVTPSVSITASDNPACDSITVFFMAAPVEGGPSPSYTWYLNNVAQGLNNDTIGLLGLQTGDEIYVEMTSSADCPVPSTVISNTITMTVNPLDSLCIPVISLLAQYCPFVQTDITDLVQAQQVPNANAYQYRIENTSLGYFAQPIRSIPNTCCPYIFGMNMVNGLKFNTTYDVAVRARVGGVWGSYGATCQVTTPPFPQISLLPSSCNITIPSLNTLLFSEILYNVSNYRYLITGPNGFNAIYIRGSGSNAFSLAWVPGIQYATTYDIRVEAYVNGDWGGYGPICQVTTPAQIPTTQLSSGSCNIILSTMSQILSADPVPNATNYRYRITKTGYTAIYTRNSSSNLFSMGWINSIQYGETYNVEVAAMVGGVWAAYGPICTVTTPSILPTTQLASGSCNVTLTNLTDLLYSDPVPNAQDYQYRVINTTIGFNQIYQRGNGSNAFSMSWVPGVIYNTTYTVEVRANVAGTWGSFGPMCNVTTPANIPTTQLSAQWCGVTLTSLSQIMTTDPVPNATNYQYHIFNTSLGFNTTVNRGSSSNLFSLGWVPGIQYGETYSIEVRAMVGGIWGNFGTVCLVTTPATPGSSSKLTSVTKNSVNVENVSVYPNPAMKDITINFFVDIVENYQLRIYDLTGKTVYETNSISLIGINETTINVEHLRKGLYVIDIMVGDNKIRKKILIK